MDLRSLTTSLADGALDFVAGTPVVYHCHHFNLFLDQTVDDALGPEAGQALRARVARDAWTPLLAGVVQRLDLRTPAEREAACLELHALLGHGRMSLQADASGGRAEGEHLHWGTAWREKYALLVRRLTPADAVGAGFVAAATRVAHRPGGTYRAREVDCVAMDRPRCTFEVVPAEDERGPAVTEGQIGPVQRGMGIAEERIRSIERSLRQMMAGVVGDERGLVEVFGVFLTRHSANYYNGIAYGALDAVRARDPAMVATVEELLRESGHVCVFHTFGGILCSPEWEAIVGRVQGDLIEVVSSCLAVARALGFGHWTIEGLGRERLVLRTHAEYESCWFRATGQGPSRANSYFLQGAAVAIMRLATGLDWHERPALDQDLYEDLFRTGKQWAVEQTHSLAAGDGYSRVVVSRC